MKCIGYCERKVKEANSGVRGTQRDDSGEQHATTCNRSVKSMELDL